MVCNALFSQSINGIMEMNKMRTSDLHREWARVLDMCEGTGVSPAHCWKLMGCFRYHEPDFGVSTKNYEFAIAILEGKPVFVGDTVYWKDGTKIIVTDGTALLIQLTGDYSWQPPKKTFILNGVELPCPSENSGKACLRLNVDGSTYDVDFDSSQDAHIVLNELIKIFISVTSRKWE